MRPQTLVVLSVLRRDQSETRERVHAHLSVCSRGALLEQLACGLCSPSVDAVAPIFVGHSVVDGCDIANPSSFHSRAGLKPMDCCSELTVEVTLEGVIYVSLYWLHQTTTPGVCSYEPSASIIKRLRGGQKVRLARVIY